MVSLALKLLRFFISQTILLVVNLGIIVVAGLNKRKCLKFHFGELLKPQKCVYLSN